MFMIMCKISSISKTVMVKGELFGHILSECDVRPNRFRIHLLPEDLMLVQIMRDNYLT